MGLMDKFSDPSLFDSLSFGDKMAGSAITMLMGMGITFVVLMLLWGVFALMGKCMSSTAKKGDKASAAETKANATPSVTRMNINRDLNCRVKSLSFPVT